MYTILCTGHFLLTNLLLEDLKKVGGEENDEARIVIVSSSMHDPETMKRKNSKLTWYCYFQWTFTQHPLPTPNP